MLEMMQNPERNLPEQVILQCVQRRVVPASTDIPQVVSVAQIGAQSAMHAQDPLCWFVELGINEDLGEDTLTANSCTSNNGADRHLGESLGEKDDK
jgi:hypothetical protein